MTDNAYPNFPDAFVSSDEISIETEHQIETWRQQMADRLESIATDLGWKYRVGVAALSRSPEFEFIYRAKVFWLIEGQKIDSIEVLWQDTQGRLGEGSSPVDVLDKKPVFSSSRGSLSKYRFDPNAADTDNEQLHPANDSDQKN